MIEDDIDNGELSPRFETARTATFSDSVIAIAATLLVLDLKPPRLDTSDSLGSALSGQWLFFVAMVSSFALIGLIWIHHHRVFRLLEHADNTLLNINLVLMFFVVFLPYPTALLAEFPEEDAAALLYTSTVALVAMLFNLLWHHAKDHVRKGIDPRYVRSMTIQYKVGAATYLVLVAISPFSVHVSIGGNIIAAIMFAVPPHAIRKRLSRARSAPSTATP